MVFHPSTNRAQCKLTSLIKTNALLLRQTATIISVSIAVSYVVNIKQMAGLKMLMRCMMATKGEDVKFCQHILKLLHSMIFKTSRLVPHDLR